MESSEKEAADAPPTRAPEQKGELRPFVRTVARNERIFEEGDEGRSMYFIREGKVRISKVTKRRVQPLAVLQKGTFFGEMAVLNQEPRTARAEAATDCTLLEVDASTLQDFLLTHPNVAFRMIQTLTRRLHDTDELIERLLEGNPTVQVIETLFDLAQPQEEGGRIVKDMNALVIKSGTDERLLKWILARLKRGGFIRIPNREIELCDEDRLRQYANFVRMQSDVMYPPDTSNSEVESDQESG